MELLCDLHIHTIASGHAYSTLDEVAKAASEKGLKVIAITDHGPAMAGGAHDYYFWNLRVIPEELYGVKILKGAEVNILDHKGGLDLPDEVLKTLDVVIAALHPFLGFEGTSAGKNTQAVLRAFDNPYVNIMAHPGNPLFPIDYEQIIEKAMAKNILLEINDSSKHTRAGSYENCVNIARMLNQKSAHTILGSDAHFKEDVGRLESALAITEEAGFPKERIYNYYPEKLIEFLKDRSNP